MPRWRSLCKEGEEPSSFIEGEKLQKELELKNIPGWSGIPEEWLPAIKDLVAKIRKHWTVDGSGMLFMKDKPKVDAIVRISQIKDKFGSLRFYYNYLVEDGKQETDDKMHDTIEKYVAECEERLQKDDPYYNIPY